MRTRVPTVEECLRVLGLGPAASKATLRATFRTLMKTHHPDVRRSPEATGRFIEIVQAYRVLEVELSLRDPREARRRCPRCGRYNELFEGLDGKAGCVECLLGETQRGRLLPPSIVVIVRHLAVFCLCTVSVACGVAYWRTLRLELALASLAAALGGMLLLALTCISVRDAWPE